MTRLQSYGSALLEEQMLKTFCWISCLFLKKGEASKYQKCLLLSLYVSLIYGRKSTRLVSILFSGEQGRRRRERGNRRVQELHQCNSNLRSQEDGKGLFLLVKLRIEPYTPRPVFCNCFAVFIMLKGNVNICYIYTLGYLNDAFARAWCTVWSSPVFPT